jgi:adenylate kinase family enzyme
MEASAAPRVHVFGAAGSGTSTLGRALANRWSLRYFDTDDYYWQQTDPPYTLRHAPEHRLERLQADLAGDAGWVISGSLCGWGDPLMAGCTLAVFTWLPTDLRMARLVARERARFGDAIEPGGAMHEQHRQFITWARAYGTMRPPERSMALHEEWMRTLPCPVLRLDTQESVERLIERVEAAVKD